jgi:hypothetical protein
MTYPITTRLLCAAQQAYEINVSGPAPDSSALPAPPPSSLVGWLRPPAAQVAGDNDISAVLVGETASEIIVAYRGTEPPDSLDHQRMVIDWIDNFVDHLVTNSPEVPGSVHYGFSHGVNGLWSWLLGTLKSLPKAKPLYVTGHSKGGAMANIAAVKLSAAGYTPFVCTFEAARAGDQAFAGGARRRSGVRRRIRRQGQACHPLRVPGRHRADAAAGRRLPRVRQEDAVPDAGAEHPDPELRAGGRPAVRQLAGPDRRRLAGAGG